MRLPLAGSVTPMLLLWSRAIWLSASSVDMLAGAVYTLPCRGEIEQHEGQGKSLNSTYGAASGSVLHRCDQS
jgi:hypothetical protein